MQRRIQIIFLMAGLSVMPLSTAIGQPNNIDPELAGILEKYVDAMGGRVALQKISSVRLSGTVTDENGQSRRITVLKKKPDLVRIVIDTGPLRIIQGYDGKTAWFGREAGRNAFYDRLPAHQAETFIREAPLENDLVNFRDTDAVYELGEDTLVGQTLCYRIVVRFPDQSKVEHFIEKETFLEKKIIEYNAKGEKLAEIVPEDFKVFDDVTFSTKVLRMRDGVVISTMELDEVETNVGLLNEPFSPPVPLPPQ